MAERQTAMTSYILRRLLLIIPTLLAILLVNFAIVQAAPGGPVEQAVARLQGIGGGAPAHGPRRCTASPAPPVAWTR
jgi:ABC-type microcin C transport system permease subunit YejB